MTKEKNGYPDSWQSGGVDYDRELLSSMDKAGYLQKAGTDEFGRPLYAVDPELLLSVINHVRQCERWRLVCIGKMEAEE